MKKCIYIKFLLLLTASLTIGACSREMSRFDGSRSGNESHLSMDYKVLNGTDTQELELTAGDTVFFDIASLSGTIGIQLQKEEDTPVYEGSDIPTSTFQVEITDSGTYTLTVTGKRSRGKVSVTKETPENQ